MLDDIAWLDLALRLEEPMLQRPPADLAGIIRIGEPDVFDAVALARQRDTAIDPEIALQLAHHDFSAVRIPLSVRPTGRATVEFLSVEITLESAGGSVTAWSMDPQRVDEDTKVVTTLGVSGKLSIHLAEISPSGQQTAEYIVRRPAVKAYQLGCPDPAWEFTPLPGHPLDGVQLLHLVVRSPQGAAWSGTVGVRAGIQADGWPWPFRAAREAGSDVAAVFRRP